MHITPRRRENPCRIERLQMKTLRYGIEIETIGQTRQTLAKAIQTVVGGTVTFLGDAYDSWAVLDATGRTWKVMSDSSLSASYDRQGEVVSPILTPGMTCRRSRPSCAR
jgi:hypothetical protein